MSPPRLAAVRRVLPLSASLLLLGVAPALAAQAAVIKLEVTGDSPGTDFGHSVAGLGDLDGDGHPEVVVGAPHASPSGVPTAGAAYVFAARSGELLYQLDGRRPLGSLGDAVANGGDMDGDGLPEILLGAYNTYIRGLGFAGRVYVCSGDQMSLLYTIDGDEPFGFFGFGGALAGLGDIDSDGFADMAIGKAGFLQPGKLYAYSGTSPSPDFTIDGPFFYWTYMSIAGAGDVDADGHDDFVIGACLEQSGGVVRVFSGATHQLLLQVTGQPLGALDFGRVVASAGDLDADGKADLWISAPATDVPFVIGAGKVYAYSVAKASVLLSIKGQGQNEYLGESLADAGDVDGDGTTDVVAGGRAGGDAGVVRVYSGKTGTKLLQMVGGPGDRLGESVAGAGDVDGDGRQDVVVGAPSADPHGVADLGAVYVLGL